MRCVAAQVNFEKDGRHIADIYNDQVKHVALSRLLLVKPPGTLTLHQGNGTYAATPIATELLCLEQPTGFIRDLKHVFDPSSHVEDVANRTIIFKNLMGVSVRLRQIENMNQGVVFLVEDVSLIVNKEFELAKQGRDIRGLFEFAPYGIYRSTLDGKPVRCNPAMVRMCGYETEAQLFSSLTDTGKGWYVDPSQRQRFVEILERDGIVIDFISEVHLHSTGTTMWVSETAWVFKDPEMGLELIEGTAVDATARVEQERNLRRTADTDWLTGLANRSAFQGQIEKQLSNLKPQKSLVVILLDLDRFKDVNDVFGHARGDLLLKEVANRLRAYIPADGFVARLGGDEFGLILPCEPDLKHAVPFAASLSQEITKPYKLEGSEHVIGASIGLAAYPQHGQSTIELLKAADLALYKSKKQRRGELEVFDAELAKDKILHAELIRDLRGADSRNELELHYQPIVDANTGAIAGFEALMRWRHPVRGLVPPMAFIPIAEEAGFMVGFGNWAIEQACSHASSLPEHLHVSVNVSAVQFYSSDLPKVVAAALTRHGLKASRLELEVTESFLLINEALTQQVISDLKALGVQIVLDDFGTGYSSLSYLQRFNFDKVKIDKSFIRSLRSNAVNSAIVRAVLSIGRDLGLAIVAEGIETETERDDLLSEGCPYFQGYLYGKPKPLLEAAADLGVDTLRNVMPATFHVEEKAAG
jgi:diguanylate cyclase (GGDEF)-like protein